ncbi:DNA polymerase III subunit beta [Pseudovibrio axinellae]|uniref:Beta sliding clamp n=1 Tax=Pseudovibrio axinellae TaxID=989403 RepID=A0A165XFN0_9HYPH|nr:DNA polymerase III subunit beta [Pseudovibrio axinellae]KZL17662.1 DNA polymerase III subunit beta [Pseudovibrio axinellae]SER44549.1 DNA polymerase-3 subunit beta [Pseudovibrio axinellae]
MSALPQATIAATDFSAAIKNCYNVAARRSTISVLTGVVISGNDNGELSFTTTDLDQLNTSTVRTTGDTIPVDFTALVSVEKIKKVLDKSKTGTQVELTSNNDNLELKCGSLSLTFPMIADISEFPDTYLTEDAQVKAFELSRSELKDIFTKTLMSVSTEATRYYLGGVYMHTVEGNTLIFTSTDGHRMTKYETRHQIEGLPDVIIPALAVKEMLRRLKDKSCPETVTIEVSDRQVNLVSGHDKLRTKVVDGTFPDYQRIIPELSRDSHVTLKMDAKKAIEAIGSVTCVADKKGHAIKIYQEDDSYWISCSAQGGTAKHKLEATGEQLDFAIGFNNSYVTDILKDVGSEAQIHLSNSDNPAVIQPVDTYGLTYVLMPMRP